MAFIPAGQCARVFLGFTVQGVPDKGYVLHFRKTGVGVVTLAELEDLGNAVSDWISAELRDATSSSVVFQYLKLRALDSETAPAHEIPFPDGIPGTLTGDALPGSNCVAVHKGTATGGKSGAGRVFHTGIQKSAISGNTISAGLATLIQGAWAALNTAVTGDNWVPAVVSFQTDNAPRAAGVAYPITSWTLRDRRVDTQRRRLK